MQAILPAFSPMRVGRTGVKHTTPLGEVVSLYCDCVTSTTGLKAFMDRLDENLLKVSNKDAELLLKSLQSEKKPAEPQVEHVSTTSSRSFWSSFLSLPVAEGKQYHFSRSFPANFDLSTLNGANGFILNGISSNDMSGTSVAEAGDVNGDGIGDIIVGAPSVDMFAGQSYVVFGSRSSWSSPISFSSLDGTNGFILNSISNTDLSGSSVGSAGDVNGDGIGDIIVGAPTAALNVGQSYVVFGKKGSWSSPISLSSLNGSNGFTLNGIIDGDEFGDTVASAGDVNGDGIDDIIVGAWGGFSTAGQTYVVFGSTSSWSSFINPSLLDGNNGFIINGINANDFSGTSVSGAGDVNGDGIDDIIVGASGAFSGVGASYVIFGKKSSWSSPISLSSLNGNNGCILNGGASSASAGDVNGDGIGDIFVGATNNSAAIGQNLCCLWE